MSSFEHYLDVFSAHGEAFLNAVKQRSPLHGAVAALTEQLPVPANRTEFLALRSVVSEIVAATVHEYGARCDVLLPVVQLSETSANGLRRALTVALTSVLPPELVAESTAELRAAKAVELIRGYCGDPSWSAARVAKAIGVSEDYLSRLLKARRGCSFRAARRQARVEMARERLEHSLDSIKEIAVRAGYSSTSQFDRDFKALYALAPGEYRRRNFDRRHPKVAS